MLTKVVNTILIATALALSSVAFAAEDGGGTFGGDDKNGLHYVRAVRSF